MKIFEDDVNIWEKIGEIFPKNVKNGNDTVWSWRISKNFLFFHTKTFRFTRLSLLLSRGFHYLFTRCPIIIIRDCKRRKNDCIAYSTFLNTFHNKERSKVDWHWSLILSCNSVARWRCRSYHEYERYYSLARLAVQPIPLIYEGNYNLIIIYWNFCIRSQGIVVVVHLPRSACR